MNEKYYKGNYKNGEIEINSSTLIFQNKYIEIFNDSVIFPSGNQGTYIRMNSPTCQSVAVLPVTSDNRIIMIKNFRHGVRGWGYEIPKGGVEKKESCLDAAKRELFEETGYTSERLIEIGEYSDSPAIFNGFLKCYIALDCVYKSEFNCETTEAIAKVERVNISDYFNGKYQLDFNDALTELLLYKYMSIYGGYYE